MKFPNLVWAIDQHGLPRYGFAAKAAMSETKLSRGLNGRLEFTKEEKERISQIAGYRRLVICRTQTASLAFGRGRHRRGDSRPKVNTPRRVERAPGCQIIFWELNMQRISELSRTTVDYPAAARPAKQSPPRSITGQRALVLRLSRERPGLSSVEAIQFAILRLPNRISELRKQGFQIAGSAAPSGVMTYRLLAEPSTVLPLRSYAHKRRQAKLPLFQELRGF